MYQKNFYASENGRMFDFTRLKYRHFDFPMGPATKSLPPASFNQDRFALWIDHWRAADNRKPTE
jgi:hypothetical protein